VKTLLLSAHLANVGVLIALATSFPLVSVTSLTLGKAQADELSYIKLVDKFDMVEEVVPSVTNEGIKVISCLATLTSLELNHCEWVDTGVGSMAALTALTRLSLVGCTDIYIPEMEELMRLLAPLTALSSLSVQCCYEVVADEEVSALGLHTSLTSLDFGGCILTDVGVTALASLTALKSLSLWRPSQPQNLTDLGVDALASLTQRTSLNLGHCRNVTDAGVTPLASLPALTSLNFKSCYKVSSEGMMPLALVLTNLTSLNLSSCNMTDVGVTALAGLSALTVSNWAIASS
jgi:hypothetical protein